MSYNTVTTTIDDNPTNYPDDNESTTENPDTEPTDTNSGESTERRLLYDLETGLFVLFNIL